MCFGPPTTDCHAWSRDHHYQLDKEGANFGAGACFKAGKKLVGDLLLSDLKVAHFRRRTCAS
jgi:hypothetical protein